MKPFHPGPSYWWQGLDAQGQLRQGQLRAGNAPLACAQLRRQGIAVQKIHRQWWTRSQRIRPGILASMTRQCTTLLQAGVSLVPALRMLQRNADTPAIAALWSEIRQDVESGLPFSQALARHPEQFDPLYLSMVHAGETGGILDAMMERLASTLEKNEALRARVRSALTYPTVVVAMAIAVLVLLLLYVVPVFAEVFSAFGAQLPLSTQIVLTLSQAMSDGALWLALLAAPMALLLRRQWQQTGWRRHWQRQMLNWPGIGPLVRASVVARWAHTLSALLAAGVPLSEALPVAGQASGHPIYERINAHLQRRVAEGGKLSEAMAHTDRFPDMLVQMCAIGEETGTLDAMLGKAATLMTEELDGRLHVLSSLIEPIIILALGGAIGVILVAMYLPIFRLGQVF